MIYRYYDQADSPSSEAMLAHDWAESIYHNYCVYIKRSYSDLIVADRATLNQR